MNISNKFEKLTTDLLKTSHKLEIFSDKKDENEHVHEHEHVHIINFIFLKYNMLVISIFNEFNNNKDLTNLMERFCKLMNTKKNIILSPIERDILNKLDRIDKKKIIKFINISKYKLKLSPCFFKNMNNSENNFDDRCLELYLHFSYYKFVLFYEYGKLDEDHKSEIDKISKTKIIRPCISTQHNLNISSINKKELYDCFKKLNKLEKYNISKIWSDKNKNNVS